MDPPTPTDSSSRRQWPFKFNGTDQIAAELETEVDAFVLQTFENFQNYYGNIYFHPARDSRPIGDQNGMWVGEDRYIFDVYGKEDKKLNVRINRRGRVCVHYAKQWVSLTKILLNLSPPINIWDMPKQQLSSEEKGQIYKQHWLWWQKTGQKFRLLDLPLEIRGIIYGFALVKDIQPWPGARCRLLLPSHAETLRKRLPNVRLLRTNRQVSYEASHILYRDSVFVVEKPALLEKVLMHKQEMKSRISRLNLQFCHKDFWKLFGFCASEANIDWLPMEAARMLRTVDLTELTLTIPMPHRAIELPWLEKCCQKTAVDWILESAWPWVKGHQVEVRGGVKIAQRKAFLKKCAAERAEYLKWRALKPLGYVEGTLAEFDDQWTALEDGGVRLDGQEIFESVEEVEEVEKVVPPPCSCRRPCWKNWTPWV